MNEAEKYNLSKVRLARAEELLSEAKDLLESESYKSANNRAYYSIEKSIKALLALEGVDAKTHSGVLHLFNTKYVSVGENFTHDDYLLFKKSEYIRTVSDYDDFYTADKKECEEQVKSAETILSKVKNYINEL